MFHYPDIDDSIITKAIQIEKDLTEVFRRIDDISEENQYKVLSAFIKNKVCEADFNSGSGYGYNEVGREKLEKVYADIFHTEDALVRPQITCGTHALFLALSAILLPGDEILFLSGAPYDSLEKSIGITDSPGSLKEHGVTYRIIPMLDGAKFDLEAIKENIRLNTKIAYIQRSKGYVNRPSLSCDQIKEAVSFVRSIRDDIILFVDNCYGEFVETNEPTDAGADICVGSLIKNPGGGLAPMGGYIAGRADLIERCAYRLTAPGLGKEIGGALGTLKSFYQGLSLAPKVVSEALKNAHFLAAMCEAYGFHASPSSKDVHHCIVEAIDFFDPDKVIAFCQAIQHASYVDSYVTPEPWEMPGYNDPVIMASGAFMNGSSIELSADGPLREPYTVYYQGGLTYEHGKYAIMRALTEIMK